mgnify:FL=1
MERTDNLQEIRRRIYESETGTVFVTSDFADITDNKKSSVCLMRLTEEKLLRRIMRGVYDKPEYNRFLQEYLEPAPDKVANAIARNYGWTIVPCGDTALNLLGLSTQVPAIWLYVSDGPYKEYSFNNTSIKFKHTANKGISKLSYKTSLVIQALKALGKENIDNNVIVKLSKALTDDEKKKMLNEAKSTTSWIYEYIKSIARSSENE